MCGGDAGPRRQLGHIAGDAADTYVPRSGSPSRSLNELACAASECDTESMLAQLSLSRGTVTTPQSPYAFVTGNKDPVDLSWARTMYCDCTITMPERDRDGKLGNRSADACHLGYDPRRGAHFCYVPTLQRLSSFTVTEWREDAYTVCKAITADTPVEYFDPVDLPIAPVTAGMMPRRYTARAHAAMVSVPLTIVIVFSGRPRDGDIERLLEVFPGQARAALPT